MNILLGLLCLVLVILSFVFPFMLEEIVYGDDDKNKP